MSFIGNFAAAQSAKAIGKYNSDLYYQQAQLAKKKADLNLNDDEIIKQYIFAGNEEEYNQFKGYEKEFGDLFKSPEETNISKETDFEW